LLELVRYCILANPSRPLTSDRSMTPEVRRAASQEAARLMIVPEPGGVPQAAKSSGAALSQTTGKKKAARA
jgi:hypothetical protein